MPVDVEQHDQVDQPDQQQERGRHARADQPAHRLSVGTSLTKAAERAIATDSATTIVEWPSEKKRPTADRPLAVLHQLAGRVVDRRDVVRVDRVAQAEGVGEEGGREQDRVAGRDATRVSPQAVRLKASRNPYTPMTLRRRSRDEARMRVA